MQIGQLIDFRNGACEIAYLGIEEVVLKRRGDERLFLWSKRALYLWTEEKRERDRKAKEKAEREAKKKGANHVN